MPLSTDVSTEIRVKHVNSYIDVSCGSDRLTFEVGTELPFVIAVPELCHAFDCKNVRINGEDICLIGANGQRFDDQKLIIFDSLQTRDFQNLHIVTTSNGMYLGNLCQQISQMVRLIEEKLETSLPVPELWIVIRTGGNLGKSFAWPGTVVVGFDRKRHSSESLYRSIAHEMIHQWIPGKKYISSLLSGDWLFEAIPSYLSGKLLVTSGLVPEAAWLRYVSESVCIAQTQRLELKNAHTGTYNEWHSVSLTKGFLALHALAAQEGDAYIWNIGKSLCTNRLSIQAVTPDDL